MAEQSESSDFIRDMIREDLRAGRYSEVVTRFPPEPNGWLHIGHAKAICLDFGVAEELGGRCHLRMDDTNPTTESMAYVEAIQRDVRWLGFDWGEHMYFASDYFERFYEIAERLVKLGRAYVCDLSEEEFSSAYRGTIAAPGKESPYRGRSADESLDLLRRMRAGEFADGAKVLRAKIDMASPNMKMRDPPLVRIKHAHHYRTGDAWCIYPLYDFAHCLEDSFEGVTHSLCTMEFESARELYDWVIEASGVPHVPKQTEFARLNLGYTVLSKRRLLELVRGGHVAGWDDPRMPTLAGLRRRGVTPGAVRTFCRRIGVAKNVSTVDVALLEHTLREDLDTKSPRVMGVLRPLSLVVESLPEGEVETFDAPYWPEGTSPEPGAAKVGASRAVPFARALFIERDDFAEDPPKGYHRLAPGRSVRLRHAYIVTCTGFDKDERGEVVRVRCTHDPATRGGAAPPGTKIDGTIHWVSAEHAEDVEVRLYDRLFSTEIPGGDEGDWLADLNPRSLEVVRAKVEPSVASAREGERYQLERTGFFYVDPDAAPGAVVLNRTVALKDSWAKAVAKAGGKGEAKSPKPRKPERGRVEGGATREPQEISAEAKALIDRHGLKEDDARVIAAEPALAGLFADAASSAPPGVLRSVASALVNVVLGELRAKKLASAPFSGDALVELVSLEAAGTISKSQAKDVLAQMIATGERARAIVEAKGMAQIASADALDPMVDAVLADNADAVARYRAGNANVMGALVGMVMKKSAGRANAKLVSELLKKKLTS